MRRRDGSSRRIVRVLAGATAVAVGIIVLQPIAGFFIPLLIFLLAIAVLIGSVRR